jgi:hypothetical protein
LKVPDHIFKERERGKERRKQKAADNYYLKHVLPF